MQRRCYAMPIRGWPIARASWAFPSSDHRRCGRRAGRWKWESVRRPSGAAVAAVLRVDDLHRAFRRVIPGRADDDADVGMPVRHERSVLEGDLPEPRVLDG